jgi:hypothetical protein
MPIDELPLSAQVALYNNCAVDVPHEILSTWVGDAARMEARIAELERERCEHCGATLNVSGCQRCGAPVCCPQCCQIQSLTERVRKVERERDDALQVHVDRRYRCPDCNGQRVCPSNGVAMWCTLCGGTGAVSFDPSLDK